MTNEQTWRDMERTGDLELAHERIKELEQANDTGDALIRYWKEQYYDLRKIIPSAEVREALEITLKLAHGEGLSNLDLMSSVTSDHERKILLVDDWLQSLESESGE